MSIRRYKYFAIKKLRKNLKLKTIRRFDFLRRHYEGKKNNSVWMLYKYKENNPYIFVIAKVHTVDFDDWYTNFTLSIRLTRTLSI